MRNAVFGIVMGAVLSSMAAGVADAGTPVVESYTGKRPDRADEILRPMFEVFAERGCLSGPALSQALEVYSRDAIAASPQEIEGLSKSVDTGINYLDTGKYLLAADTLARATEIARKAPGLLARDDSQRGVALRAYVGLSIAFQRASQEFTRKGMRSEAAKAKARADETMAEAVRSFPGMEPDRVLDGSEVVNWWRQVRDRQTSAPTGTLVIEPGDPTVNVFVQESYVGRGLVTKAGVPPGLVRVYTERPEGRGRVHLVDVGPGQVQRLVIDWDFDAALYTSSSVGFSFTSPVDHRERRRVYAGRIATMLGEKYAIIVGLSSRSDGHHVFGMLVDRVGTVIVSGEALLDVPAADREQVLRSFAQLLTAGVRDGAPHVQGVAPLDLDADPLPWADQQLLAAAVPEGRSNGAIGRALSWSGLGATSAVLGAGLWYMAVDGTIPDQHVAYFRTTKDTGIKLVAGGVALSALTGYAWGRTGPPPPRVLAKGPWRWIIGGGSVAALAAGAVLIAYDDPGYSFYDGKPSMNPTMRPTLVPGGILATVGGLGLGTFLWLSLGSPANETSTMVPVVNVSGDGGSLGVMGRF